MSESFRYGVLLPHFGPHSSRDRIIEGAQYAERTGFDSVWVRDHLVFHPHKSEDPDRTFIDPFVAMSAIAGATRSIMMATGALIPHRNPVHAALLVGSLDYVAGPDRILLGVGIGSFDHEFAAAGMEGWDRREVIEEQVKIMRALWTGEEVSHSGKYYSFTDTDIHPTPTGGSVPIWYAGTSQASVRRAVEYCDGWVPGRLPLFEYSRRIERMRRLAEEAGKPVPNTGTIPYVVPGATHDDAVAKVDVDAVVMEASRRYKRADGSPPESLEDLDGAVVVGDRDEVVAAVRRCQEAGAKHFVFDLRLVFDKWEESLALVAEDILPELHSADGR